MSPTAMRSNPFMLLLHPEVVVAAMEKSERLSQLNRHLCRPWTRSCRAWLPVKKRCAKTMNPKAWCSTGAEVNGPLNRIARCGWGARICSAPAMRL
jgi:hypothetical protein